MRRRFTALAVLALALTAAVGYAGGEQAAAASRFGNTFTLVETNDVLADEATHAPPDFSKPIPPGDSLVFKADLLQERTKVGEGRGVCTSVFDTKFVCNVVFAVADHGSLSLQVLFDPTLPEGEYAVTGGTGEFAFKQGWAHFKNLSNGDAVHTFHLRDLKD